MATRATDQAGTARDRSGHGATSEASGDNPASVGTARGVVPVTSLRQAVADRRAARATPESVRSRRLHRTGRVLIWAIPALAVLAALGMRSTDAFATEPSVYASFLARKWSSPLAIALTTGTVAGAVLSVAGLALLMRRTRTRWAVLTAAVLGIVGAVMMQVSVGSVVVRAGDAVRPVLDGRWHQFAVTANARGTGSAWLVLGGALLLTVSFVALGTAVTWTHGFNRGDGLLLAISAPLIFLGGFVLDMLPTIGAFLLAAAGLGIIANAGRVGLGIAPARLVRTSSPRMSARITNSDRDAGLGAANLGATNLGATDLGAANFGAAGFQVANLGAANLGAAGIGSVDLDSDEFAVGSLGMLGLASPVAADSGTVNGKPANGKRANGKPANGKRANSKSANGKFSDRRANGKSATSKQANGKVADDAMPNDRAASGIAADGMRADARAASDGSVDGRPVDGGSLGGNSVDGNPVDGNPVDGNPVDGNSAGGGLLGGSLVDGKPGDGGLLGGSLVDGKPADGGSLGRKPASGNSAGGNFLGSDPADGDRAVGDSVHGDLVGGNPMGAKAAADKAPDASADGANSRTRPGPDNSAAHDAAATARGSATAGDGRSTPPDGASPVAHPGSGRRRAASQPRFDRITRGIATAWQVARRPKRADPAHGSTSGDAKRHNATPHGSDGGPANRGGGPRTSRLTGVDEKSASNSTDPTRRGPNSLDPHREVNRSDVNRSDVNRSDVNRKDQDGRYHNSKSPASKDPSAKDSNGKDPSARDSNGKDPSGKDPSNKRLADAQGPRVDMPKRADGAAPHRRFTSRIWRGDRTEPAPGDGGRDGGSR